MSTDIEIIQNSFKLIVHKIFNNWAGLRLCVEHGMGGRNGLNTAIEIMNYIYEYCIHNENITKSEIKDVLEEIMDQEFNTLFEDNSITDISAMLLKYLQLVKLNNNAELIVQLSNMKCDIDWLKLGGNINIQINESDEEDSNDSDSADMEVDDDAELENEKEITSRSKYIQEDDGWTTIRTRRNNI